MSASSLRRFPRPLPFSEMWRVRPAHVLGGVAVYGVASAVAYVMFAPPKASPPLTADQRRDVFSANATKYDSDVGRHEKVGGIESLRKTVLAEASGRVLEIGAGTARNLEYYAAGTHVTLSDNAPGMLEVANLKLVSTPDLPAQFETQLADASALPFPDGHFDTVVDTFSLCSFEDPGVALGEMCRVLRPGGKLLLIEHGRSSYGWLSSWLDKHTPGHVERHGCYWNRDVAALVSSAAQACNLSVARSGRRHMGTTYWYVLTKPEDAVGTTQALA